jgi:hypothetical protein
MNNSTQPQQLRYDPMDSLESAFGKYIEQLYGPGRVVPQELYFSLRQNFMVGASFMLAALSVASGMERDAGSARIQDLKAQVLAFGGETKPGSH